MKEKALIGALLGLLPGLLFAQNEPLPEQTLPETNCQEAITVFIDSSRFSRRGGGAKNMNETHAEYTNKGWRFEDMEIYVENGDMEGFFLTYSRDIACSQTISGG